MMGRKLLKMLVVAWGVLVGVAGCWYLVLWNAWPLWSVAALFVALVLLVLLAVFSRRRWLAWRVRRRLAAGGAAHEDRDAVRVLDRAWRAGFGRVRRLRKRQAGGPLYALPWLLMLGESSVGKSALLAHTRLASTLKPVRGEEGIVPTDALDWWYFDRSVVLDPAGRLSEDRMAAGDAQWRRLMHWLGRSRRREPLNGIVLVLSLEALVNAGAEALATRARTMRSRIDNLTNVYGVRIPLYIALTHAECIDGFADWMSDLPQALRDAPFGHFARVDGASDAFVDDLLRTIAARLADIRLARRAADGGDPAFLLPERIIALAPQLKAYLHPAFDFNPYGETPLLSGIFFTAQGADENGTQRGWFSRDLFDVHLPCQRHASEPVDRLGGWRRLFRHSAVAGWLVFCLLTSIALTWGFVHDRETLLRLAEAAPQRTKFSGSFAARIGALSRYESTLSALSARSESILLDWMPFHRHVRDVEHELGRAFCTDFRREALERGSDAMLDSRIQAVARGENDTLVAAYAQHLVRRINLLDAAIAKKPLTGLPEVGADMLAIEADAQPGSPLDPQLTGRFGTLYNAYLQWETRRRPLVDERAHLLGLLDTLALSTRRVGWLLAWADLQGDLAPVTLAQFWGIRDRTDLPRLSAAFTPDGHTAIHRFIGEIRRARQFDAAWHNGMKGLDTQYRRALSNAWYGFMTAFVRAPQLLRGEDEWRSAMAGMSGPQNPYQQLLHEVARVFDGLREGEGDGEGAGAVGDMQGTSWIEAARRLDRLQRAVYGSGRSNASKVIEKLRLSSDVGRAAVQSESGPLRQIGALRDDFGLAQRLATFRGQLDEIGDEMARGDGHAAKLAADAYGYATSSDLKTPALVAASTTFQQLDTATPVDQPVWNLIRGPLDFSVQYASRVAASMLQKDWDAQVLAPLQGVTDAERTMQLVYADKGLVPTFMDGTVSAFVERRTGGYVPRELWGQRVPLNGVFYAFVSRAQREKNGLAETAQRIALDEKAHDEQFAARQREIEEIDNRLRQMQTQIASLQGVKSAVAIKSMPPDVNVGARVVPQKTTLALQCTGGRTTLENLNFATSATFVWSYADCGDTVLKVEFPGFTLTRQWSGPQGFIAFLRTFRDGQRAFGPQDFPGERSAMASANVQSVKLSFDQQGQAILLSSFAEADRLTSLSETLRSRKAALATSAAAPGAPATDVAQQPAFDLTVPMRIADPWNDAAADLVFAPAAAAAIPAPASGAALPVGPAQPLAASAPDATRYAVQVGVFAHPARVNDALRELGVGYENRAMTPRGGSPEYLVLATGFVSRAEAARAARRIAQRLQLKPAIVTTAGG